MESISFIKELSKKGVLYQSTWLNILLKYECDKPITLNSPVGVPSSTFYRIINFGVSVFSNHFNGYSITKTRNQILIAKNKAKVIKPEILKAKTKQLPAIVIEYSEPKKEIEITPKAEVIEVVEATQIAEVETETKKVKPKTDKPKHPTEVYEEIVKYLSECTGIDYRANSKVTQSFINARLGEGFTVDDFKRVIETKSKQWLGTEWQKYLRPQTIFSNKFESYLNETIIVEKNKQQIAYDTVSKATKLGWNN